MDYYHKQEKLAPHGYYEVKHTPTLDVMNFDFHIHVQVVLLRRLWWGITCQINQSAVCLLIIQLL